MSSINKPISKSIFKPVHNPLKVPPALLGGGGGITPIGPTADSITITADNTLLTVDAL
jgi:hypothetical protein